MKSFDESCVENCEIILIEEYPCQNKKQPEKKEGEYIGNDKSRLNRCIVLVGLERNITMQPESITSTRRNNTKYSNREYWKIQRKRQTASWEQKTKYKKEETLGKTDKYDDKN